MIQKLKQKKVLALAASLALMGGVALAPTTAVAGFLTYGDSQGVVNSYNECWQAEGGMAQSQLKGPKECMPPAQKIEKITATLSSDVLFAFDKSVLKPEGEAALTELAAKLKSTPGNEVVNVIGHTDPVGSFEYNLGLSKRRADAVSNFLRTQGVNVNVSKGMSFKELVVECQRGLSRVERDKCNQPNRRAVVTAEVVSPDAPAAPAKAPAKKK
ncbi:MAG: OmpA family protein [Gammaproteobacteria bacterium]|jgi:OOP family OmpA-OmpF porin|nr:OmpA family protein [Gammaproteobacteria bacterium]